MTTGKIKLLWQQVKQIWCNNKYRWKKMHKLPFTITNKLCATVICIHNYLYWQDFSQKKDNNLKIQKFISLMFSFLITQLSTYIYLVNAKKMNDGMIYV